MTPRRLALAAALALAVPGAVAAQSPDAPPPARDSTAQAAAIAGSVRDAAGRVVAAAEILIDGELRARSDSLGRFVVTGLPAGEVELLVRRFGHAPADVRLRLAAGTRRNLRVELQPLTQELAPVVVTSERRGVFGRVRDTLDAPIAGAEVQVLGAARTVRSDDEGMFRVPGLEPGPYVVVVRHAGHRAARFSLEIPERGGQEVAVELAPLAPGLGAGAARAESGFGTRDRWLDAALERRLGLRAGSRSVVVTRGELAPKERLTLADYLSGLSLINVAEIPARPRYHLASPGGEIGVSPEPTSADARPYCLFLDGELDVNAIPLGSIHLDELEMVEVVRDDLSGTLARQLEGHASAPDCHGVLIVAWFRR
jgi:hypothetical protein